MNNKVIGGLHLYVWDYFLHRFLCIYYFTKMKAIALFCFFFFRIMRKMTVLIFLCLVSKTVHK